MLSICLFFQTSELKYAYKFYAYKKRSVCEIPSINWLCTNTQSARHASKSSTKIWSSPIISHLEIIYNSKCFGVTGKHLSSFDGRKASVDLDVSASQTSPYVHTNFRHVNKQSPEERLLRVVSFFNKNVYCYNKNQAQTKDKHRAFILIVTDLLLHETD